MLKRALIALAAVTLIVGGVTYVAHAATTTASCVDSPGVDVTCTVVVPYPAASTVTVPGPTVTATVTATTTASSSSTPTVTPTPTPTVTPTPTTPPTSGGFPTKATTGLPAGWVPKSTVSSLNITTAGAVVEDVRVNGSIIVNAANVTLRRVEVIGGMINNYPGNTCRNGLKIYDSTIRRGAYQGGEGVVSYGGYTADNVLIDGAAEGFRVGGKESCGPVTITNSYADVQPPTSCGDWHGDGLQGYGGGAVTIRNSVLILGDNNKKCYGTAPFFYPVNQGNTSATIDGLIVAGGGFPFRDGMPGSVKGLHIVSGSWVFGPIDVKCSALTGWQASISTLNAVGQPAVVRAQPCNTESGT